VYLDIDAVVFLQIIFVVSNTRRLSSLIKLGFFIKFVEYRLNYHHFVINMDRKYFMMIVVLVEYFLLLEDFSNENFVSN
jgi:hypothetical protein